MSAQVCTRRYILLVFLFGVMMMVLTSANHAPSKLPQPEQQHIDDPLVASLVNTITLKPEQLVRAQNEDAMRGGSRMHPPIGYGSGYVNPGYGPTVGDHGNYQPGYNVPGGYGPGYDQGQSTYGPYDDYNDPSGYGQGYAPYGPGYGQGYGYSPYGYNAPGGYSPYAYDPYGYNAPGGQYDDPYYQDGGNGGDEYPPPSQDDNNTNNDDNIPPPSDEPSNTNMNEQNQSETPTPKENEQINERENEAEDTNQNVSESQYPEDDGQGEDLFATFGLGFDEEFDTRSEPNDKTKEESSLPDGSIPQESPENEEKQTEETEKKEETTEPKDETTNQKEATLREHGQNGTPMKSFSNALILYVILFIIYVFY